MAERSDLETQWMTSFDVILQRFQYEGEVFPLGLEQGWGWKVSAKVASGHSPDVTEAKRQVWEDIKKRIDRDLASEELYGG